MTEFGYTSPSMKVIGSVKDLTQAPTSAAQNKLHSKADVFTAVSQGAVVGSLHSIVP